MGKTCRIPETGRLWHRQKYRLAAKASGIGCTADDRAGQRPVFQDRDLLPSRSAERLTGMAQSRNGVQRETKAFFLTEERFLRASA